MEIKHKSYTSNTEVWIYHSESDDDPVNFTLDHTGDNLTDAEGKPVYEDLRDYLDQNVPGDMKDRSSVIDYMVQHMIPMAVHCRN